MIAALYVETDGAYFGLPDVDPWDEARDARLYAGPWPVVARPPCSRWSIMGLCRGYGDGADGGCFEAALAAVRTYGGVLEHPAHTLAWRAFHLPRPARAGWTSALGDRGWTCEIDQRRYGHDARKPTWLYYVGDEPPAGLDWGRGERGAFSVDRGYGGGREHLRSRTPPAMRAALIALAAGAIA